MTIIRVACHLQERPAEWPRRRQATSITEAEPRLHQFRCRGLAARGIAAGPIGVGHDGPNHPGYCKKELDFEYRPPGSRH